MSKLVNESFPPYITVAGEERWYLLVKVQPGAKKSELAGEFDGRLRIKLAAQPIENKANKALVSFIAKTLGLRPSRVSILSGDTGRQKRLLIDSDTKPDWSKLILESGK